MKKSLKVILIVLVLIFANMNIAMAATPTLKLAADKTTVSTEDIVTVVLSQESGYTLSGMTFTLEYDTSSFELQSKSGWNELSSGVENDYRLSNNENVTSGNIMTFTFKALKDTNVDSIKLKNIVVIDNQNFDSENVGDLSITGGATAVTLTGISITNKPTTTIYTEGSIFDPTGMEITAAYSDGTAKAVTNYTYTPSEALTTNNTTITITYTENDVTQTVILPITVNAANVSTQDQSASTTTTAADTTTTTASSLPNTGNRTILIVVSVIGLAVLGLISYKGYQKYKGI